MRKKSILVIDDEISMTDSIMDVLDDMRYEERIGDYNVYSANDFYGAMDCLESKQLDLIITDLLIPGEGINVKPEERGTTLNGWRFLLHYIFKPGTEFYKNCKNTKIIIFSAYIGRLESYLRERSDESQIFRERIVAVDKAGSWRGTGGIAVLEQKIEMLLK